MNSITILKAGACSSIQDLGRYGYGEFGMPVSGVMDEYSYKITQAILSQENKGAIECALLGCEILFNASLKICISGADMDAKINQKSVLRNTLLHVNKGDILSLGVAKNGVFAYIAFSKSFKLDAINGSLSTYEKANIGGFCGRRLKNNDEIFFLDDEKDIKDLQLLPIKKYDEHVLIKVLLGTENEAFSDEALHVFLNSTYTLTPLADRMGYRLSGEKILHKNTADIISNPAVFGSIQVPNDNQPIILMADRQTTGGYTKIATVLPNELPKLAQLKVGGSIKFEALSIEKSREFYINETKKFQTFLDSKKQTTTNLTLKIDKTYYQVAINNMQNNTYEVKTNNKTFILHVKE